MDTAERNARLRANWTYRYFLARWRYEAARGIEPRPGAMVDARDYMSPVARACTRVKQQIDRERALIWLRSFSKRALAERQRKREFEAMIEEAGNVRILRRQAT